MVPHAITVSERAPLVRYNAASRATGLPSGADPMRLLILLCLTTTLLPAQIPWWGGEWEEALEEAQRRNVPLMVAFVMDGEEANDRVVSGLHQDAQFQGALQRAIAVIASRDTHKPKEQKIKGKSVSVCSKFGFIKCSVHRRLEQAIRPLLFPDGRVQTPMHVVLLPDETEVGRVHDVNGTGVYVDLLKKAQKKLGGRGLTRKEFRRSLELLQVAKKALGDTDFLAAGTALDQLEKMATGTPVGKEASAIRSSWNKAGMAIATDAEQLAEKGEWVEALRRVRDGGRAFKGSSLAKDLRKVESRIGRTREGRAAARILKAEDRARPSFEKGVGYEAERDYARAVKAYYRVINLAEGSSLADKARVRLDALTSDRDIAPLVKKTVAQQEAELALKAARVLLRKQRDEGRVALEKIVETWPKTSAADKARKLLKK